jgi:hypothetical protein
MVNLDSSPSNPFPARRGPLWLGTARDPRLEGQCRFGTSCPSVHLTNTSFGPIIFPRARGSFPGQGGGDVAKSISYSLGWMFSCSLCRVGRRRGVRGLLQPCRRYAGFRKAQEVSRCSRNDTLRGSLHDFGLRVCLLADSDRRRKSRFRLFEPDRGRSGCNGRATVGHRPIGRG